MIPKALVPRISRRLYKEIGIHEPLGDFCEKFAFLPSGHDIKYALDTLKESADEKLKKGINIILEEIVK